MFTVSTLSLLPVALLGLALLIPLGTAAVRRPQVGILLLVALLPYDGLLLLVDLPGIVGGWKEGAVLAILIATLIHRSSQRTRSRAQLQITGRGRQIPGFWVPTAALLAMGLVSFAFSPDIAALTGVKVAYFYLLLPVILWLAPLNERDRDRMITIFMVNGAITSIVGLGQQALGPERLNSIGYEYNSQIRFAGGIMRTFSTFVQPFPFAFFVMVVLLLGIPVALTDRRRRRNQLFLLSVPVLVLSMSTAIVRGAMLGLAVGGLYLIVRRFRVLGHGAILLAVAILLGPGPIIGVLASPSSLNERTTGWVSEVIDEGVEPFGSGIGSVGAAAERVQDASGRADRSFPSPIAGNRYQPDNYYVKTLLELGPLGLWFLLWSLASAISFGHRLSKAKPSVINPTDRAVALGITAASLAAAGAGIVAAYWEIFPVDAFYWLLLGVLPSLLQSSSTLSPSPPEEVVSRPTAANSWMPSPV
ncbi:MAG: O-antigen ligase domain-containing protein [Acidimicrobiales bacterium]|nr:O-antigen ligase domain-containing protein [Acidimicrobiales bacterium]